ncbi:MAG TPA: acyl-CoA dehydrogenase family protein [Candidatus Binataceae bacterium]
MDLNLSPQEEAFRVQVRGWLAHNRPVALHQRGVVDGKTWVQRAKDWQRRLYEAGYLALSWPKEYGGQALDPMRQAIVSEELMRANVPGVIGSNSISMLGPTLITWGTEEQKRRYLPKILTGEEIWCQGYSEPGAGSDLASLRTRAELQGDEFVVNGQKVWTSGAHIADMMFGLVRTNPEAPKHSGISYLLIDMKSPGITVRPLVQMNGEADFCEVFFDNARVPRANLVGELHSGWKVANTTMVHERNWLGASPQRLFDKLMERARGQRRGGVALASHPLYRQRLADLQIEVEAMRLHGLRLLSNAIHQRPGGVENMVAKLVGTELHHRMALTAMDMLGNYATLGRGEQSALDRGVWSATWFGSIARMFGGGTSEIQKNVIAERGLQMPKAR